MLCTTQSNSVVLKAYNYSNRIIGYVYNHKRHIDKIVKCRFFVVPGDCPALLGMLDIEVLGILKITCEVVDGQQVGRKFGFQIT